MATFLYRSRPTRSTPRLVALLWVAILVGAGVAASTAPRPARRLLPMPGTESQKAFDLLDERFPAASAEGATARVVIRAPDGGSISDPAGKAKVEELVTALGDGPQVSSVADPFKADAVSEDGTTAYASVTYKVNAMELTDQARDSLTAATDDARSDGFTVETGGDAVMAEQEMGGTAELIGIGVAAIVLLLTFGSLVAAGMPLPRRSSVSASASPPSGRSAARSNFRHDLDPSP